MPTAVLERGSRKSGLEKVLSISSKRQITIPQKILSDIRIWKRKQNVLFMGMNL